MQGADDTVKSEVDSSGLSASIFSSPQGEYMPRENGVLTPACVQLAATRALTREGLIRMRKLRVMSRRQANLPWSGAALLFIAIGVGTGKIHANPAQSTTSPNAKSGKAVPFNPCVIRLHAVRVSDDDGSRRASVECEQVQRWVDYANKVYKPATVQFTFDSDKGDFTDLRSTIINSMMRREKPEEAREEVARARAAALGFSGKMVVFFRYGAGPRPTGEGFSSRDSAYIIMPGFECTRNCEQQNIAALAHEVGHYLGLDHTFVDDLKSQTVAQAEARLRALGGNVSKFDGDGLSDTPPDPGIEELGCTDQVSVQLNGGEVAPAPRQHHVVPWQQTRRSSLTRTKQANASRVSGGPSRWKQKTTSQSSRPGEPKARDVCPRAEG